MTYNEAQSMYDRIKGYAIGYPIKGRLIDSLFIAPTKWEELTDFMNLRIQKGEETALLEFSGRGKSLSVYGVSKTKDTYGVPCWNMIKLDDLELMVSN